MQLWVKGPVEHAVPARGWAAVGDTRFPVAGPAGDCTPGLAFGCNGEGPDLEPWAHMAGTPSGMSTNMTDAYTSIARWPAEAQSMSKSAFRWLEPSSKESHMKVERMVLQQLG